MCMCSYRFWTMNSKFCADTVFQTCKQYLYSILIIYMKNSCTVQMIWPLYWICCTTQIYTIISPYMLHHNALWKTLHVTVICILVKIKFDPFTATTSLFAIDMYCLFLYLIVYFFNFLFILFIYFIPIYK